MQDLILFYLQEESCTIIYDMKSYMIQIWLFIYSLIDLYVNKKRICTYINKCTIVFINLMFLLTSKESKQVTD